MADFNSRLERLMDRWFEGATRDTESGVRALNRWKICRIGSRNLVVHQFLSDDDLPPHRHPRRMLSIGFYGRYIDKTIDNKWNRDDFILSEDDDAVEVEETETLYRAPWIRITPPGHTHRIVLVNRKPCWTLVLK